MSKKVISIVSVAAFAVFIGMIDYLPLVQLWNDRRQEQAAVDYDAQISALEAEERQQQKAAARDYNEELITGVGSSLVMPFQNQESPDGEYDNLLNIEQNGIMGTVRIPKIKVHLPIYHGTAEAVMQKGAGHIAGSSLPVGGDSTHTCISAHRGLPSSVLFTDLDLLEPGDIFYLEVLDETLAYQIYDTEIVTPDQIESLKIQRGKDLATLITCTPYGVNTHRIYVHGMRISGANEQPPPAPFLAERFIREYWWIIVTAVLTVAMSVMLYRFNQSPEKRSRER